MLREQQIVDEPTLAYLADYRFGGDIWGYPEGETYFPYSPLLVVESTFAEAVLLETVLLSIYNHDSAIASAASRMTWAAGERPCIEMGSRRTHEWAAVAAARAAYVAGFTATSNLRARLEYGVPTAGTSAHSFTLLHDTEADAFRAQVHSLGKGTTLLVDTYDIAEAVRLGVEIAGPDLGAVRIDSGDLARARLPGARAARRARRARRRGSSSPPTSTSSRSPGCPRRRSTGTASAPSWSPAAATRPAGSSTSWSPARTRPASWSAWRRRARTRSRSAAASTPCAASPPTAPPRPRCSASAGRWRTTATTASLLVPLVTRRRGRRARAARGRPRASPALARRAPAGGAPAVEGRPGDRDALRGLLEVASPHEAGADRRRRAERLLRGRFAACHRRRPGRERHRRAAASLDPPGPAGSVVRRRGGHQGPPHRPRGALVARTRLRRHLAGALPGRHRR